MVRHFEGDDEIFAKGDAGDALSGVLSGGVCIHTISPEGEEAILNILEPGEMFGEIALLDGVRARRARGPWSPRTGCRTIAVTSYPSCAIIPSSASRWT